MPDSTQLSPKKKELDKKYLGPRALNRRQLARQNLIFLVVAIIIIAGLAALVIFNLSFIVEKINQSFKVGDNGMQNITQFDLKSFEQIQNKLGIVLTTATPTPTPTPTESSALNETATTTPIISINPLPIISINPLPSASTSTLELNIPPISTSTPTIAPSASPI